MTPTLLKVVCVVPLDLVDYVDASVHCEDDMWSAVVGGAGGTFRCADGSVIYSSLTHHCNTDTEHKSVTDAG